MQSSAERLIVESREDVIEECFPNKMYSSRKGRLKLN